VLHAIVAHVLAKIGEGGSAVQYMPVGANHWNPRRRPRHAIALRSSRRLLTA
jgi:hypothetical protein